MNGAASGSWSDGVYAIVKTEDWSAALLSVVSADLGGEDASEEELIVAIWEFLCFLMVATSCAANWSNKIVFYATDNELVWRWLTNMRSHPAAAPLRPSTVFVSSHYASFRTSRRSAPRPWFFRS